MTFALTLAALGLLALAVGVVLGAYALFGVLGVAGALIGVGAAAVAAGLLVDFERSRS